ncbi:S-type pyocin domain-containing protein [Enterobacteriaceae bacterium C34A]
MAGFDYGLGTDLGSGNYIDSNGQVHITITGGPEKDGPGGTGGSNNGGGGGNTGSAAHVLVLHNGQMGYWETRVTSNAEHDHYQKVFVAVGPSEAQKAAAAAKALQDKKQAEAAANAFAKKVADAATAAAQGRDKAVADAAAAGQHQSVSAALTTLNNATAEATRLKSIADATLADARSKRQAANAAGPAATQAEQKYQNLQQSVRGLSQKNGVYGRWSMDVVGSNKEHDLYANRFHSAGITVAQVEAARVDAVNKRNAANSLPGQASAAEQAAANAAAAYQAAETRRQAAAAALTSAQQAAARAAEAERQRLVALAAAKAAAVKKHQADVVAKAAEAARVAAEQEKARQVRQAAADKLKSTDVQSVRGISASAPVSVFPLSWAVASGGGISLGSDIAGSVWSQIAAGLAELRAIATASIAGPVAVTVASLLYSRDVGLGSDVVPGRDISTLMPGDALGLPDAAALNSAADTHAPVTMPIRGRMVLRDDGTLETQLVRTLATGSVPVIRAVLDKDTGYWGFTLPAMQGVPGQTILVSPSDAPGTNGPLGLTGPVPLPEKIVHTGGQDAAPQGVTATTTPVADDLDFNDLILIFPPEALLKPLYVMLRNPRNMPGTADGKGQQVGDNWLGGAGIGDGAPIPGQIADKLRGKTFSSFDSFRNAFWKAVADDPELSKQFHPDDVELMKKGYSPSVSAQDSVGKRVKMELHHKQKISKGGDVYNVDNLNALTPRRHIEIHKGE